MNSNNRLKGLSSIALSDIIGTSATAFFWFFLASLITPEEYGEIFFYLGIVKEQKLIERLITYQIIGGQQ